MGIYPFAKETGWNEGQKTLLTMDLWGQFFPMFVESYNNIRDGGSPFWSWNGMLGFNVFAQSAYYTHSLFNLLFLPFAQESLQAVFHYITLLKYACCSLTFCIFLRYKYQRIDLLTVAFSLAYAFCGYMLAYISQPIVTDIVILAPIVTLGLERLIFKQKPLLYVAALFAAIYSNFYIAYSLCIFTVLYFIVTLVAEKGIDIKKALKNFFVFSLIAGALAAFELIPVALALRDTVSGSENSILPSGLTVTKTLTDYFSKLMPGTDFTLVWQVPNIFSGIISLIALPLFFLNRKFSLRKKIAYGSLIVFMLFSMTNNIFIYFWHGFHYPNQLNGRWTFLFTLFILMIAYETILNIRYITKKQYIYALFVVFLIVAGARGNLNPQYLTSVAIAVVVMIVVVIYVSMFAGNLRILVALLLISEVFLNTVLSFRETNDNKQYVNYNFPPYENFSKIDDYMEEAETILPEGFYRQELNTFFTFDAGQLFDYKGITYYGSVMSKFAYNFFKSLGLDVYTQNISTIYTPNYPIVNSLLNIRFIINHTDLTTPIGFEEYYDGKNYKIFENKYTLPLAFIADSNATEFTFDESQSKYQQQNALFNAVIGKEVDPYTTFKPSDVIVGNAKIGTGQEFNSGERDKTYYLRTDSDKMVTVDYKYTVTQNGYYMAKHGMKAGALGVIVNGINTKTIESNDETPFLDIGYLNAGDDVILHFESNGIGFGLFSMDLSVFDEERFAKYINQLKEHSAEIISATDTKIVMELDRSGLVYTSVPAVDGWKVKVNGKTVKSQKIGGYLLAFNLTEQTNRIELTYRLPGLLIGIIISVTALLLLILYIVKSPKNTATQQAKILSETDFADTAFRELKFESEIVIDFEVLENDVKFAGTTDSTDTESDKE
jgi:uncharacterized membrane protein YfhO